MGFPWATKGQSSPLCLSLDLPSSLVGGVQSQFHQQLPLRPNPNPRRPPRHHSATATATGAKRERRRRRLGQEGEVEELVDRISHLPDGILGDIVSLLPSKDGACTQVLSSRWRPIWRSAPLNLDLIGLDFTGKRLNAVNVSRIVSAHQGPGRRFCTEAMYCDPGYGSVTLNKWLQSSAVDILQELKFHYDISYRHPPPPLTASVDRFSSTLRAASIGSCSFPEENSASALHLHLLKQLSLLDVRISETSLYALLAACPALQSLLLTSIMGFSRVQIVSPNLRSIGLRHGYTNTDLQELVIEDAPCLERLICYEDVLGKIATVSVISAPKLHVFAPLFRRSFGEIDGSIRFGITVFQRFSILSLTMVVHSVKVLALTQRDLCLDMVINFLKCFPCLEKLYITATGGSGEKNTWCRKYKNLIATIEIHLKKIVLADYRGNASHVNFAKFFVLNATMLQSMRLELYQNFSSAWIERQHGLIQIKDKASRDAQFDFVAPISMASNSHFQTFDAFAEQVHDLSTADPFVKFHNWA
ncbi:unnamed protein product [Urochloa decumbens]|uniref:FBD domain-containing protein n=1 Tax=Urochloa decumbens TaxID=240449 RepID=A0ABC9BC61_9POAL